MAERVVMVTGGASGIGAAVAQILAEQDTVIVADLNLPRPEASVSEGIIFESIDVNNEQQWVELAEKIGREYGRLDGFVLAAGIAPIIPLTETNSATVSRVLETNLGSMMTAIRVLWPLLVSAKGAIVLVSSVASMVGQNSAAAYVASKGGVVALARALAVELAPHGVRVNAVSPGPTDTDMLRQHFGELTSGAAAKERLEERMPIGRLLQVSEVARPIVWLLDEQQASGMTGINLVVDGGLTATFDFGNEFAGGGAHG